MHIKLTLGKCIVVNLLFIIVHNTSVCANALLYFLWARLDIIATCGLQNVDNIFVIKLGFG